MPNLHPAVDRLLHSGNYVCRPRVEGFTEHELKSKDGKVIRKVTRADLEQIAKVNNQKAANGALTPIGPGHTFDDTYDAKGQLVSKFPEEKQPKPFGYLYNYRVELNPHTNKYSLIHDEYIQRLVLDPETGKMVDGMQYSATFPRRSAEVYHNEHWMDWMAAIRRAPRLDLGLSLYAKHDPDHALYSRAQDGKDAPVLVMARDKTRYSFDTGGDEMADPAAPGSAPKEDPTKPPTADGPPSTEPAKQPGSGLEGLHAEAAERYAHHASGMHPSRFKKLMGHLHQRYAAELGMDGDMNTEYAMPGPSNVMPAAGGAAPSGATPPASPPKTEPTRMQQDQANIEHARYERELAEIKAGLAEERAARAKAEAEALHSNYERQLLQMVYEGYEIDAAKELEFCTKRKYSREQFDDHVGILRRMPHAPISHSPLPLDPEGVHRSVKLASESNTQSDKYAKNFDKIQREIRNGKSSADAYESVCGEKWQG